jgi:chaperonin GroES
VDWNPIYDKLIVRRDPPEAETASGLAVPDAHQKQQHIGTVLKTGQGRWVDGILLPLTVQPGMRVLFSKFAGTELAASEPDVIVIREDEILAYAMPVTVELSDDPEEALEQIESMPNRIPAKVA